MSLPQRVTIVDYIPFLEWLGALSSRYVDLKGASVTQVWGLAALAALARREQSECIQVDFDFAEPASRFAQSIGFSEVVDGLRQHLAREEARTVPLCRVNSFGTLERVSGQIAKLVASGDTDTEQTIKYVLVELLRNAVQHSRDPLGAIVGAQRMDPGREYGDTLIQVVVADTGIGIHASLRGTRPDLRSPEEALNCALLPHVSGAFTAGAYGSASNAGLGLFFISEMAKKTAGRLLVVSRGASLFLAGDPESNSHHTIRLESAGFPGTVVAFEMPSGAVVDYESLLTTIQELAREREPVGTTIRHVTFTDADSNALRILVRVGAEDTNRAMDLVTRAILPSIGRGRALCLDFSGVPVCTQSFLHALLFLPLQLAFDKRVSVHAVGASQAVENSIRFLESYALRETKS